MKYFDLQNETNSLPQTPQAYQVVKNFDPTHSHLLSSMRKKVEKKTSQTTSSSQIYIK